MKRLISSAPDAWQSLRILGAVSALLLLLAGCDTGPATGAPRFRAISLQPGDGITIDDSTDEVTIDINSEKGLGSVEIERLGLPPKALTVNFQLKGLEELRFTWGSTRIFVYVASGSGAVREEAGLAGGQATPIDSTSPYWMPVRIEAENPKIPLQNGFFAVTAPQAFLQAGPQRFTLKWIDFYRYAAPG